MIEDLRLGLKMLWRRRKASALAIVVLALGIGLSTAMFSVLDGVLLRGLPFPDGDRIAMVSTYRGLDRPSPKEDFLALRKQPLVFDEVAAFRTYNSVLTRPGIGSRGFTATYVTGNLFDLLGVEPILGRGFVLADEDPGAPSVAVLSHKVWQTQFGGDLDVIGRPVVLNRESMTIVGVMPEGFFFPIRQEAWAAMHWQGRPWSEIPMFVIGKLRPGMVPDRAALELAPWALRLDEERPLGGARQVHVRFFVNAMRILVNPYQADFETAESRRLFWDRLLVDLEAEPAMQGATLASAVPWGIGMSADALRLDPADPTPTAELPQVRGMRVLPGFFDMLRLPLLAGRGFERGDVLAREEDGSGDLPVVVSESFARRHFAGSPLDRSFALEAIHGAPHSVRGTVVGVVANQGLGRRDQPDSEDAIYTPYSFAQRGKEFLVVRGRGTNSGLVRHIDHAIEQINPLVATLDAQTFEQARVEQTWTERRLAQLFALFAILSLVLSGVGLSGAITLSLGHRRRELAIRAALGALPGALRDLILRQGGQSISWGILLGAGLAWWTFSFLERFLYQVEPWDPRVTVTSLLAVAGVSMMAMHGPVTSAARTDPATVLGSE